MMSLSISELIYPMCLQGYAFQCSINPPLASTEHIIGISKTLILISKYLNSTTKFIFASHFKVSTILTY